MALRAAAPIFLALILLASLVAFVGYKYIGMASEYRLRNFNHLAAVNRLTEILDNSPIMRLDDVELAREQVLIARQQAVWCLETLSMGEKWLFQKLGAGEALEICEYDIATADAALIVLEQIEDEARAPETGSARFSLWLQLNSRAEELLDESLAFQPFVSVIEVKLTRAVQLGTVVFSIAVSVIGLGLIRTLFEAQRAREMAARKAYELATIAERTNDSIVLSDPKGVGIWANKAFFELSGYLPEEIIGKTPGALLQGPETDVATKIRIRRALKAVEPIKCEILNYKKDGEPYWIDLSLSPVRDSAEKLTGFVAITSDITERKQHLAEIEQAKRDIEYQALHDALTDLPNRRAFDTALAERQGDADVTVLRIDLDHFKYVNDTQGHDAGDFVLSTVADIMRKEIDETDIPARLGGDEFAILIGPDRGMADAELLGRRLLMKIRQPMDFNGNPVQVGASFGIAGTGDNLLTQEGLMVGADAALYNAKESGRNRVHCYTPALHIEIEERLSLADALSNAIAKEEFVPYYQPQVNARTMHVTGVETLVRWPSERFGMVSPDAFMPVAERLTLVDEIDRIVFRKAIEDVQRVRKAGHGPDKISFNVTSTRLQDPALLHIVKNLDHDGFRVSFEVLESVLIEDQRDQFHWSVDAFRELGVGIEIDDFGSGHASIVGLMQMQPDVLKIDKKLVDDVVETQTQKTIVESVVQIARAMGVGVTAEGVETIEQADLLTRLGVDTLQGYLFSRPLDASDLALFLKEFGQAPSETDTIEKKLRSVRNFG